MVSVPEEVRATSSDTDRRRQTWPTGLSCAPRMFLIPAFKPGARLLCPQRIGSQVCCQGRLALSVEVVQVTKNAKVQPLLHKRQLWNGTLPQPSVEVVDVVENQRFDSCHIMLYAFWLQEYRSDAILRSSLLSSELPLNSNS